MADRSPTTPTRSCWRAVGRRRPADAPFRRPARPAAADRPGAGRRRHWSASPSRARRPRRRRAPTSSARGTSASTSRPTASPTSPATTATARRRNMPTRGRHRPRLLAATRPTGASDPSEYGAIHFHRDDLEDAGWEADFELTIPADLPSGIYAAWLQAGDDEDYLPFTVRPPRGTTRSRIAVLMSTVTYVTYANFTDIGRDAWREGAYTGDADRPAVRRPDALPRRLRLHRRERAVRHVRRPRGRLGRRATARCCGRSSTCARSSATGRSAAPARFPADLYQVDWLEQKGIEVDYLTDHDLIAEGVDLLRPYTVVVSSSHHEYWTAGMLDALGGVPRRRRPVHVPRRQQRCSGS